MGKEALEAAKSVAIIIACLGGTVLCYPAAKLINKGIGLVKNTNAAVVKASNLLNNYETISASIAKYCKEADESKAKDPSKKGLIESAIGALNAIQEAFKDEKSLGTIKKQLSDFITEFKDKLPELTGNVIGAFEKYGFTVIVNNGGDKPMILEPMQKQSDAAR